VISSPSHSRFSPINTQQILSVLLIIFTISLSVYLKPQVEGDAAEYVMMQQSFRNHFTPEFRDTDIDSYYDLVEKCQSEKLSIWFQHVFLQGIQKDDYQGGGYLKGRNGYYYSCHFWTYSMIGLPIRIVFDWLGFNPLGSFVLLNSMLVVGCLILTWSIPFYTPIEKAFLELMLVGSCAVYYFGWIHPEVFTTCLVYCGLILSKKSNYLGWSCFCFALASTHNPPIAFVIPGFGLYWILIRKRQDQRTIVEAVFHHNSRRYLLLAFSVFLILLPSFYFLWVIHATNPIVSTGGADFSNISLSRLSSLWFDLNQGMILGFGALMLFCSIAIFMAVSEAKSHIFDRVHGVVILASCLILSVLCLPQGNWNSGSAVLLRYCLWIGIGLPFAILSLTRGIRKLFRNSVLLLSGVGQISIWSFTGIPAKIDHLYFNKISRWVLDYHPEWYNPEPEIFAERLCGKEEALKKDTVFIRKGKNERYKVLAKKETLLDRQIWIDSETWIPEGAIHITGKTGHWFYLSGAFSHGVFPEVQLDYENDNLFDAGWSVSESGFRWSVGTVNSMKFHLPEHSYTGLLKLCFTPKGQGKSVSIFLNGKLVKDSFYSGAQNLVLSIDPQMIHAGEDNTLEFNVKNPEKSMNPSDPRILGFQFRSLTFQYK